MGFEGAVREKLLSAALKGKGEKAGSSGESDDLEPDGVSAGAMRSSLSKDCDSSSNRRPAVTSRQQSLQPSESVSAPSSISVNLPLLKSPMISKTSSSNGLLRLPPVEGSADKREFELASSEGDWVLKTKLSRPLLWKGGEARASCGLPCWLLLKVARFGE